MSTNQVPVELRIKAVDAGATSAIDKVAKRVDGLNKRTETTVAQSNNRQRQSFERLSLAREQLSMRSEKKIRGEIQQTEARYKRLADSGKLTQDQLTRAADVTRARIARLNDELSNAAIQSNSRQRQSFERLSLARETLGVRSEQKIQREIQQTEAAYKRLAQSGKLSQDEISRAAEKTRQKITKLTNELGKLTAEQQRAAKAAKDFEAAQGRIRASVAVGAGVAAAAYTLKAPVMTAMSFDERLAGMANTAYPERNASGRLAGAKALEAVINRAVDLKQGGGGTRDQAAEALDALIAKGSLPMDQATGFLPAVMRTAYGSGANPLDIANLVSGLVGQGIVGNQTDLKRALNMITASGQAGGFEIKDMARALPGQLAVGKTAGLVGLPGLQKILTMNQAAVMTAGDTSTAGNNVLNLLTKLSSNDTGKDFEKAGRGDLAKFLVDQRIKGVDAVDAWMALIDRESASNPLLKSAMAKLNSAKTKPDQQAAIDAITQLSEGSVIGQYFQDMQARGALFGLRNKGLTERVGTAIGRNNAEFGANDLNYQTMAGTGAAAMRNADQELQIRQKDAMEKLIPTITRASEIFVDLSQKYPSLSSAVVGATPPLIALATAAGISAAALGGKSLPPALAGAAGKVVRGGAVAGLYGAAAVAGDVALDAVAPKDSAINRYGKSGLNGAAFGATMGSIVPVVGTGVGALLGGASGLLYEGVGDMLKRDTTPQTVKADAHLTVDVAPGFVVKRKDTGNMSTTINQSNTGNLFSGAPR